MDYGLLATAILTVHFGYLAYLVFGGFAAWAWPRTIWLHVGAAGWGFLVVAAQLTCPLTVAEAWARDRAGQPVNPRGFIDEYIEGVLYPERYTGLMQALAALAVLGSWAGLALRQRRRRRLVAGS